MSFNQSVAERGLTSPYRQVVFDTVGTFNLDLVALVMGIIARESEWNARAFRAEPQINDASYGLMQILLGTARQYNPDVTPEQLFDPAWNIELGSRYLLDQIARYGMSDDAISAYNAGSPISGNASHVADVRAYQEFYLASLSDPVSPSPLSIDVTTTPSSPLAMGGGVILLLGLALLLLLGESS